MLDCIIERFRIIGVEDLSTPYTHESQLTRPHARVVTQRLGDGMPWFVGVSVRLREPGRGRTAGATNYGLAVAG